MGKVPVYNKSKSIAEGTVIDDNKKRQWVVGQVLGEGGFGTIYTASEAPSKSLDSVIKIEPASNGPLFTEANFYMRVCAEKDITNWISDKKLKYLGMPRFISTGLQPNSDNRYLVMDRYGDDLHKILMTKDLSQICLLQIAINIVDVLEYIHSRDYSHADIKALNILQGYKSPNEVYLLDFGMVTKYRINDDHKLEKVDPKCKHNGTLEFCPRDAHRGLVSCRRSDMESLMFNLIFWLTWDRKRPDPSDRVGYGNLPWMKLMKDPGNKAIPVSQLNQVAESKEKYMKDTNLFVKDVGLSDLPWSKYLEKLLTYISQLKYTEEPKYDDIRKDLATMICVMKKKPIPGSINVNSFRDIDWKPVSRKSDVATTSRKRPSSGTDEITPAKAPKVKRPNTGKKILEVNNSSEGDMMIKDIKSQKTKSSRKLTKTAESKIDENDEMVNVNVAERIPKFAFSKVGKFPAENDLFSSSSKENDSSIIIPGLSKAKKAAAAKTKEIPIKKVTDNCRSDEACVGIIPGMKALVKLKEKSGATRSSPRLAAKSTSVKKSSSNTAHVVSQSMSVSCQTSPSLSVSKI